MGDISQVEQHVEVAAHKANRDLGGSGEGRATLSGKLGEKILDVYEEREKLKETKKKLEGLTVTDPLTGLLNRRGFFDQAERYRAAADRKSEPFAVVMIDVNHFKEFNDTNGHQNGDDALVEVADALKLAFRKSDIVGRYGGDEFIALLTNYQQEVWSVEMSNELINKINELIADAVAVKGKDYSPPTVSVGVSYKAKNDRKSLSELIKHADEYMYSAKKEIHAK